MTADALKKITTDGKGKNAVNIYANDEATDVVELKYGIPPEVPDASPVPPFVAGSVPVTSVVSATLAQVAAPIALSDRGN